MKQTRFLWKLYAGYVVLILLTTTIVGVLVARWIESDSLQQIEKDLKAKTVLLRAVASEALATGGAPQIQERVHRLGQELGTRLTLIQAGGKVLADSHNDPTVMDNHGTRPEILQAGDQGNGKSTRYSHTVHKDMMYYALPVERDGRLVGFARSALPLTVISDRLSHLRTLVALGAAIAAAVALLLGFFFARQVTRPLGLMTTVAQSIAGGDYATRVDATSKDEIGQLARAFNSMAGDLQNRMQTVTKDRGELLAILGSMVEGVIAVDRDSRIVHINSAAAAMLGTSPIEAIGTLIADATSVEEVSSTLLRTIREAKEAKGELELSNGAGHQRIQTHSVPLRDNDGDLAGSVLVLHNVTELRKLEVVRRDFVANVSHELKTPIAAIRALVETLIDDADMPEATSRRFLNKIANQSQRLSNLVTDLLNLSRLQSEENGIKRDLLDVREPLLETARAFQQVAEEKGLHVETELPPDPIFVQGDQDALGQAIGNLLDNAIKYTVSGGKIWLRGFLDDDWVRIEVQDTGIGIEAHHQERIFERFYRVDKARSRELGGTGLGLSIVKHVALALGGNVSLHSEVGRGSTFRIDLPAASASAQRAEQYALPLQM